MPLTPPAPGGTPLGRFRAFYAGVADLRRRVEDGSWPPLDADTALQDAQAPLLTLLDRLAAAAEADPAADPWTERQVRYLMSAFADDLFTRLEGPLAQAWAGSTLEAQLFQTDQAGEEVFSRIKSLLALGDPGRRGLARAYLMALVLGFRGKYRQDPEGSLSRYREALLAFALPDAQGADAAAGDDSPRLSPQAYRHTLGPVPAKLLPNVRRWALVTLAVALLIGVLSIPLWRDATHSLGAAVERIIDR